MDTTDKLIIHALTALNTAPRFSYLCFSSAELTRALERHLRERGFVPYSEACQPNLSEGPMQLIEVKA
jgi:hypothetical protein